MRKNMVIRVKNNGILFCITAPSGSGKTSVMRHVLFNELVSFTTKEMREGEVDGVDYVFITQEHFENLLLNSQLMEWTEYPKHSGYFYGLSLGELNKKLSNKHGFFVCDNNGYNQIKEKYDKVVSIFLYATKEDCRQNMIDRGDDLNKIESRLSTYEDEIKNRGQYDYVVKNNRGNFDYTVRIVKEILMAEIMKRQRERIEKTL